VAKLSGKSLTNYDPSSATPINLVPVTTDLFSSWPSGWKGQLTRGWILFFESLLKKFAPTPPVIGFSINTGATGTDVALIYAAARSGSFNVCVVVVKESDATIPLTFTINQNGTPIFATSNTVAAAVAGFTSYQFTNFTTTPLTVAEYDLFSIDISSGSSSWVFTVALQTAPAA
jgi:hypothetical protein